MKFLAAGDHHFSEFSRFAECVRVHDFIVDLVERERPDAFISTGDIYECASTPTERSAVASHLTEVAEYCPVFVVKGNHDKREDCALMARLRSRHPITVEEHCGVHLVGDAALALVAWPERSQILARAREWGMPEAADAVAQDALRHVFRGLGAQLLDHTRGPRLAAGHFMVDGSVTSVGQPLIGQPMNVGLSDLALMGAGIVLMGHIHKPQYWSYGEEATPIVYTGSPYRTSFGETEDKSVVLVSFEGARLSGWERIATPCAGMLLVSDAWDATEGWLAGAHGLPARKELQGAELRFRYEVAPDQRAAARAAAEHWRADWLAAGAVHVKVEEAVVSHGRARAPEVAAARNLSDKLLALWSARNVLPESPRKERLISMALELEKDQRKAS